MTRNALEEAIRAVTKGLECDIVPGGWGSDEYCESHSVDVHDGECALIADMRRAVTVGFEAGRRDALAEANALADQWNQASEQEANLGARYAGYHAGARTSRMKCEGELRALLSTTEEAKP